MALAVCVLGVLHVLGELGPTAADEQPQNGGEGKVGEGEEHQAILPGPGNGLGDLLVP